MYVLNTENVFFSRKIFPKHQRLYHEQNAMKYFACKGAASNPHTQHEVAVDQPPAEGVCRAPLPPTTPSKGCRQKKQTVFTVFTDIIQIEVDPPPSPTFVKKSILLIF